MDEKFCEVCQSNLTKTLTPNSPHYARLDCPKCGFSGWVRNPNNPRNKGTRLLRTGNKLTIEKIREFHGFKKDFCFFCLREKHDLGIRETLTADHILELRETREGEERNRVGNGQVLCTACHKLKLWLTTYLNEHIVSKKEEEKKDGDSNTIIET